MAFQSIVTGAECSSGSNPMTQIMKQFNEDRSLQKVATNDIGKIPEIGIRACALQRAFT